MKNNKHTLQILTSISLLLALAGPLSCYGYAQSAGINFSFKMDPRLTSGVYGGERWISPPVYTGAAAQDTVEVIASGIDAKGAQVRISPKWIPSDPEMVTISPTEGERVKITVKRAGQSSVHVISPEVSKELVIKAAFQNNVMQVEIAPLAAKQAADATVPEASAAIPGAQEASPLKSQKEKLSYALGSNFGKGLRKQSVEVDAGLIMQGLRDALAENEPLLSEQEVATIVATLQNELRSKGIAAIAEKNKIAGEAFLAENKTKEGVVELPSGLQYKILKVGDGPKPAAGDQVVCHYRGTLIDGREFDSSYKRKQPATFTLNRVIRGWNEALQLMPVGSKWQLFIPSKLAYAEGGSRGGIGPNATLIFEVELLSIQDAAVASASTPSTSPRPVNAGTRLRRSR